MKKFLTAIAAALVAAMAFASPANANSINDYLNDLADAGFPVSESNQDKWVTLGMAVCVDLMNGFPVRKEYADMLSAGFQPTQAKVLITASVVDLCPAAASKGTATA